MRTLIAMVYFALALFGCDGWGRTIVTQSSSNGVDTLYSKTRVSGEAARFECIRSASGHCHFTLFPRGCAAGTTDPDAKCAQRPIGRFAMGAGDKRKMIGLPDFDVCVRLDDEPMTPDCQVRPRAAAR